MTKGKELDYEEMIARVSKFGKQGKRYLCNNRNGGLLIMPVDKLKKDSNQFFKEFIIEYRKDMSGIKKDISEVKNDILEIKDRLTTVEHKVDAIETKVDAVALDLKETKIRNNLR